MPLQLRVKLVNGDTHTVSVNYDDPAVVFSTLRQHGEPWHEEWVEADGAIVRLSAIVSVSIEPSGSEQMVESL